MSIKCINALSGDLLEVLNMTKKECLINPYISNVGVKTKINDVEKTIEVYSFLPNLEEIQIVVKSTKNSKEIYMVQANLVVSISEEALEKLLEQLAELSLALSKGEGMNLELPKEIEESYYLMNYISKESSNKIDQLFQKYSQRLKSLRQIQKEALNIRSTKEQLVR